MKQCADISPKVSVKIVLVGSDHYKAVLLGGSFDHSDNAPVRLGGGEAHHEEAKFLGVRILVVQPLKRHCDLRRVSLRWGRCKAGWRPGFGLTGQVLLV